jgi:uncharacterized membrane protein
MAAVGWQVWALLSAVFAALTAIFGKVGVENVDPDVATFIRTLVIVVVLGGLLLMTGQKIGTIPSKLCIFDPVRTSSNRCVLAISVPSSWAMPLKSPHSTS